MLGSAVLLAAGLDHGAFMYEARALKWKRGQNGKLAVFHVCAYENVGIRQVMSESFSHSGLPAATTSFLYF